MNISGDAVEPITWRDLRAWGGFLEFTDAALAAMPLVGWQMRNDHGRPIAIGAIGWWGPLPLCMFDARAAFRLRSTLARSRLIHALALQTIGAVLEVEPAVYAWIDVRQPRAEAWARRLGFRPVDDSEGIWINGVDTGSHQNRGGGHRGALVGGASERDGGAG